MKSKKPKRRKRISEKIRFGLLQSPEKAIGRKEYDGHHYRIDVYGTSVSSPYAATELLSTRHLCVSPQQLVNVKLVSLSGKIALQVNSTSLSLAVSTKILNFHRILCFIRFLSWPSFNIIV